MPQSNTPASVTFPLRELEVLQAQLEKFIAANTKERKELIKATHESLLQFQPNLNGSARKALKIVRASTRP
jgi:hypothetical protein